jgi:hypothetical protein
MTLPSALLYLAFASFVFALVARLTRASRRRLVGALVSVIAFTAASGSIDDFAIARRWWRYPSWVAPPHPSLVVYLGQALIFVGTVALVGWRVERRFGARGVAVLSIVVCVGGLMRDLSVAALLPSMIQFGAMPASVIADLAAWALVVAFALVITRLVAGSADADAPIER